MTRYNRRSIALAVGLSALAGYVDAVGFLSAGNFFVSFMSGNSTRLGIALAQGRLSYAALAAGVILLFVAGVVIGSLRGDRAGMRREEAVLTLVAAFLTLAALSFGLGWPAIGIVAMLLAMGAENAIFDRDGEVGIGLTYMTGTLVRMGRSLAAITTGGSRTSWMLYGRLWLGLATGATLGGTIHNRLGSASLWLAVLAVIGTAIALRRGTSIARR